MITVRAADAITPDACDIIAAMECYNSVPTIGHVEFMTHNATADIILPCR